MTNRMSHGGTWMHIVSYASNEIIYDEGVPQEYSVAILVWGVGIGSHADEGSERGKEQAGGVSLPLSCRGIIQDIGFEAMQGHLVQYPWLEQKIMR